MLRRAATVLPAALAAAVLAAGCGLIDKSNRCDLRPATPQCTDFRHTNAAYEVSQRALCATLGAAGAGGTFATDATCDTTGMLGGCRTTAADGTLQTNWYYQGTRYKTVDDAKAECDSSMGFVTPQ